MWLGFESLMVASVLYSLGSSTFPGVSAAAPATCCRVIVSIQPAEISDSADPARESRPSAESGTVS